ncbi:MAG: hypothetical protein JW839_22655 [Candidatus Lokiarchaeota archaeon]|nr:hypothetical protein [Candidatus Lokiarchaeota archaeon]
MSVAIPKTQGGERAGLKADQKLLWAGIAFSIGFTFVLWFFSIGLQTRMEGIYGTFWPDFGAAWYYWQLPAEHLWPRLTAWAFYLAHQVALWVLTWRAMHRLGDKKPLWSHDPDKDHYIVLAVNLGFVILHLVQTQVWYDGLAQDMPIWTSQFSVILMLLLILLMENARRGFFWGKKLPIGKDAMNGIYKWHGYYIQWALVYTFWFHPMDGSLAMFFGFMYMFLLLFQSSTFLLKVHLGRKWIVLLEIFVWIHGTLVALESDYMRFSSSGTSWPIFFFGFMGMFVFTQQFGLTNKKAVHFALLAAYVAIAATTFSIIGWNKAFALVSIPIAEYLGALAGWGLFALVPRLKNKRKAIQEAKPGGVIPVE